MLTRSQARDLCLPGWNLRCNRCGSYGARWIAGERPGWGSLALCPDHEAELEAEHDRHREALAVLRGVRFEQDSRAESEAADREYDRLRKAAGGAG